MASDAPVFDPDGPPARLALAYASAASKPLWHGYFALEARMSEAGSRTSQPIMAQLRLAWWRDRFRTPALQWPAGEPLLTELARWDPEREALVALVDGWEALLAGEDSGEALAEARVAAMLAIGRLTASDAAPAIEAAARDWTRSGAAYGQLALPRAMRPLAVLRALAARDARAQTGIGARFRDAALLARLALRGG